MHLPFFTVHKCFIYQSQESVLFLCIQVPINNPLAHLIRSIHIYYELTKKEDSAALGISKMLQVLFKISTTQGKQNYETDVFQVSDHSLVSRIYLIKISGDEGNGIACSSHLDEATEDRVPHRSVLIHAMEQVTQPVTRKHIVFYYLNISVFEGKSLIFHTVLDNSSRNNSKKN